MEDFLNEELKLEIAEEKTRIASGKEGIQFLSYDINTWRSDKTLKRKIKDTYTTTRTITDGISLRVSPEKVGKFNKKNGYGNWGTMKPMHQAKLLNSSDEEIILTYNSELRGLANYYALAYDVKSKLGKLQYMANYSLFKTLANKHKSKLITVLKRLEVGTEFIHRYTLKGKPKEIIVFKLKHMEKGKVSWEDVDEIPNTLYLTLSRSELIRIIAADTCEYCGKESPRGLNPAEVHHVRKLKDFLDLPKREFWEEVMIKRHRKTLILCIECHDLLHAGKLPDNRYNPKKV